MLLFEDNDDNDDGDDDDEDDISPSIQIILLNIYYIRPIGVSMHGSK